MCNYDKEFKLEAIGLASEPGSTASKIEKDPGIGQRVICRWKRRFRENGAQAFSGKGHLKS
jgi:transposase-like protein